jgi:hypothetical protein
MGDLQTREQMLIGLINEAAESPDWEPRCVLGRLADGHGRDKGRLVHAVPISVSHALCQATPGPRSVGWCVEVSVEVTCPRCLREIAERRGRMVRPSDRDSSR